MNHGKKMVLVPEGTLELMEKRQNVNTPPLTARLNGLDSEIQQVLKDKHLSEDEKVRQYSQALQDYLHYYHKRKHQPINVKIQPPSPKEKPVETEEPPPPQEAREDLQAPPQEPQSVDLERQVLAPLPKTLKHRGKLLIDKIKENPEIMKWDDKGQLVLDGKVQQGTHITDLIKDSLRASRKETRGPLGWEMFTRGLAIMNAPENLIRNAQRKSALRSFKSGYYQPTIEDQEQPTASSDWFPTPQVSSVGPMRKKTDKRKEMRQRWLRL